VYPCVCVSDLDHCGDGMDTAHVLDDALGQVGHTQADGPVGVTLQLDHLVSAATRSGTLLVSVFRLCVNFHRSPLEYIHSDDTVT